MIFVLLILFLAFWVLSFMFQSPVLFWIGCVCFLIVFWKSRKFEKKEQQEYEKELKSEEARERNRAKQIEEAKV